MLDARKVTEQLDSVKEGLAKRGFSDGALLDRLTGVASSRRAAITELEAMRKQLNDASAAMSKIADKKSAEFQAKREELRALGDSIKEVESKAKGFDDELEQILLAVPNVPHASVPVGADESENRVERVVGSKPALDFAPKDHVDLGVGLGILDFDGGAKLSGARFSVLRGAGAKLERALMQFMLDVHSNEHGYEEIWPPVLVKESALRGTGQLPKFEQDLFAIAQHEALEAEAGAEPRKLYLVPTAEVTVTNLHADEILEPGTLPIAYTAYSACFRSEAGSYGRDTRGLVRQHQFDKVELVRFCAPEDGEAELEKLTAHAEAILAKLGLHYRVVHLCTGDMGFASQKTYDLEVWLPGQNAFREISSCSWFGDFQARRLKTRYRADAKAKPQLVHTLNGSGLAIGRTLVAILEQYQQADGSVVVPEALRPYLSGLTRIAPKA